jgi:hypothetical protein
MRHAIGRVERVIVFAVIAAAMFTSPDAPRFHPDESHWIGLSAPFEAFFTGRFADPIWATQQDKYLNAPMTFYVIGAARRLGGWSPDALNATWIYGRPYAENLAAGRVPPPELLIWSRRGVTAAAVVAIFVSVLLFARAAGRPAAYLWLGLALVNPYLREHLRRAMNEGVLLAALALVMWAAWRLLVELDRPQDSWHRWKLAGWTALAGGAAGLAAQTKLNGAAAGLGILAVLVMAAIRHHAPARRRARGLVLGVIILVSAQSLAFLASYPTLWPYPPREVVRIVRARAQMMTLQSRNNPDRSLDTLSERLRVVPRRVLYDDALLPQVWAGALLALAGVVVTIGRLRDWLARRSDSHAIVALAVVGASVSAPVFMTPLDWPRYYLLPAYFLGFATVLGADWAARRAWRFLSAARARR